MERSVGGHATEASQMCHEGRNRGNITALEAVYDGCRPRRLQEGSVGEHAAESSQPCWKGKIRDRLSALEDAHEGCRFNNTKSLGVTIRNLKQSARKLLNQHPKLKGFLLGVRDKYLRNFLLFVRRQCLIVPLDSGLTRVEPSARYGYGKLPHPQLLEIIDRNRAEYKNLIRTFVAHAEEFTLIPLRENALKLTEPFWANLWFPPLDSMALYSILCSNNPKRYIEIGSGTSTKFCRRAINDQNLRTRITSIDPHPRAEIDDICDEVIRSPLEDVDLGIFSALEPGDILFVDGSHKVFMNSDVTVVFLDILPNLKTGVFVHFHDIFLPLDYPEEFKEGYLSEQYLLAACLLYGTIDIVLPNAFIGQDEELSGILSPLLKTLLKNSPEVTHGGGSFWIKAP